MSLSLERINQVAALLGRQPRGLEEVVVESPEGQPMVIRVSSLVDGKPFPTLFWLIDPGLCYRIDQAEAAGLIGQFQQRIDADPVLQRTMGEDHRAYIVLREQHMTAALREDLCRLGFGAVMEHKGIGGIADFSRVRCLHTWYGAHLVLPNTVGRMLDNWWSEQRD